MHVPADWCGRRESMKFIIVTGMSGAGKSTVLHYLEDAEYYCVDNLPIPLIRPFAQIACAGSSPEFTKIAIGLDIRSGLDEKELRDVLAAMKEEGIVFQILFLDAADDVLVKRYKETRRAHPLAAKTGSLELAIQEERRKLLFMKEQADYIIDTSRLLTRELKQEIIRIFVSGSDFKNLMVTVQSFGFKYGIPADSDLVIDVRFLPNPYYVEELRPLTGKDQPIIDYVMSQRQTEEFLTKFTELLRFLIPNYISEGKNQLIISIGCTGGRHRSVALAEAIYRNLSENADYGIKIEHRDIERDSRRSR